MLRSSTLRLRERVSNQYICWQCRSKSRQWAPNSVVRQSSNLVRPSQPREERLVGERQFNAGRVARATVESEFPSDVPEKSPLKSITRERLRQWEQENIGDLVLPTLEHFNKPVAGAPMNTYVRNQLNEFFIEQDEAEKHDEYGDSVFEHGLVDVGLRRNFLIPGDMVEVVSAGGSNRELAIFVQEFTKQCQFYSMSGRWFHRPPDSIKFWVPQFVEAGAVEEIKLWLPKGDVTEDLVGKMQSFDNTQVPRSVGKPLIVKMKAFWEETDAAYQAAAVEMDNAHENIAHPNKFTYATLPQIADKVLGKKFPKMENGNFAYHILYALHRTMMQNDIGFNPTGKQVMRGESEYEINALNEVRALRRVTEKVRNSRAVQIAQRRGEVIDLSQRPYFDAFIKKARFAIDGSRKLRKFTECGVLGPSNKQLADGSNVRVGEMVVNFGEKDREWIYFLESWTCFRSFQRHSVLNGVGSSILRAIGRYDDVPLNQTTAFTCLMELGVIPPWETLASFKLRLPYTSQRFSNVFNESNGMIADSMASLRKDWGDLQVYCIDDESAVEIDDGISVEATDNPDEYWVHIHIADPAAHIDPTSSMARHTESVTASVYLPDRVVSMLPPTWTTGTVSLGPKRACLTHSVKLSVVTGEMLDISITPGIVNNVVYLTKDVMHEAIFDIPPPKVTHLVVGKDTGRGTPSRPLLQTHDLSAKQTKDFKLFHKLHLALTRVRESRGSLRFYPSKVEAFASFGGAPWIKPLGWGVRYSGDPNIRLAIPPINEIGLDLSQLGSAAVIASMMLVACEAAAKWCHARGIPVINRISPFHPNRGDPLKYYREYVVPSQDVSGFPKLEYSKAYLRLVGKTQPSTTPGPHLGIGADMTAQTTSPLRRFGDLLNHWQIEAALREEARTGTSLVGNTRDDFLPFSKARIDALLPRLAERERFLKEGSVRSDREWTLKWLVRAWKFGEAELPSPLLFFVRSFDPIKRQAGGLLPSVHIGGNLEVPDGMTEEDFQIGDAFEVAIAHVDIPDRHLLLKYVRKVSRLELDPTLTKTAEAMAEVNQRVPLSI